MTRALVLALLAHALALAQATCVPFSGSVKGSTFAPGKNVTAGKLVHVTPTGFTGFTASSVSFATGNTTDVTVAWNGTHGAMTLQATASIDGSGNLVVTLEALTPSAGHKQQGASVMGAVAVTAAVTAALGGDDLNKAVSLMACMSSALLMADAVCTLAVSLEVTLPAGLTALHTTTTNGTFNFEIESTSKAPTGAPTPPTTKAPTASPTASPTAKPSTSPKTSSPSTSPETATTIAFCQAQFPDACSDCSIDEECDNCCRCGEDCGGECTDCSQDGCCNDCCD